MRKGDENEWPSADGENEWSSLHDNEWWSDLPIGQERPSILIIEEVDRTDVRQLLRSHGIVAKVADEETSPTVVRVALTSEEDAKRAAEAIRDKFRKARVRIVGA
ncbi:hypothetical protein [Streptomyces sp. RK9]|uniref:hypothetical protein n=1 Tax=Streptomyces sp. RK9 TaxID=3239284 RepID=UPI0038645395